jgi:hypothetical protein
MKTFTLSKKDIAYLTPLDTTMNGLNVAIQVYVINQIFPRLALANNTKARYDLDKGELLVLEEKDFKPEVGTPEAEAQKEKVTDKVAEVPAENKSNVTDAVEEPKK